VKKWTLLLFIVLIFLTYPSVAFGGNEFFCSVSFGDCNFGGFVTGGSCDSGYVMPCSTGDCCLEYYNQNGSPCPYSLSCVPAPTATPTPRPGSSPTPSPRPTPTYSPGACPGPAPYCDNSTRPCSSSEYCNPNIPSALLPVPQGCTGVCTSLTPIPTVTPIGAGDPTIPVYDPKCYGRFGEGVKTGLGCLPTDPQKFVNAALPWAIGIGSGVAFLLGLYGALMIVISAGDPEKMQAGKEIITSAIAGLLLIVFAVFILRVIGVNILGLFGFPTEDVNFGGRR